MCFAPSYCNQGSPDGGSGARAIIGPLRDAVGREGGAEPWGTVIGDPLKALTPR